MTSTATGPVIPAQARAGTRRGRASSGVVIGAATVGTLLIGLDASAVNVALPGIGQAPGVSTTGLQWIVDADTLMFAALLLSAGAVSDRLGTSRRRRVHDGDG